MEWMLSWCWFHCSNKCDLFHLVAAGFSCRQWAWAITYLETFLLDLSVFLCCYALVCDPDMVASILYSHCSCYAVVCDTNTTAHLWASHDSYYLWHSDWPKLTRLAAQSPLLLIFYIFYCPFDTVDQTGARWSLLVSTWLFRHWMV